MADLTTTQYITIGVLIVVLAYVGMLSWLMIHLLDGYGEDHKKIMSNLRKAQGINDD